MNDGPCRRTNELTDSRSQVLLDSLNVRLQTYRKMLRASDWWALRTQTRIWRHSWGWGYFRLGATLRPLKATRGILAHAAPEVEAGQNL